MQRSVISQAAIKTFYTEKCGFNHMYLMPMPKVMRDHFNQVFHFPQKHPFITIVLFGLLSAFDSNKCFSIEIESILFAISKPNQWKSIARRYQTESLQH